MKRASAIFLQFVLVLIAVAVLFFLLRFPLYEGRNVNATLFQVYFNDPFLVYVYTASIAFFTALYQAFRLLGCIGENQVFSPAAVRALRTIKYSALTLIAFLVGAEAFFFMVMRGKDDIAGGAMLGFIMIFICVVAVNVAAVFEKNLQSAGDILEYRD